MSCFFGSLACIGDKLRDLSLLLIRLTLAYGFYEPAMKKLNNFESIVQWFGPSTDGSTLNLPFPYLQAVLATTTECVGVVLLTIGFLTRLISLPLIVVMLVAIFTVHIGNGFSASNNGIEIPYYYIVMLFCIFANGSGRFSVDSFFMKKKCCGESSACQPE